jgi:hypothetical protein
VAGGIGVNVETASGCAIVGSFQLSTTQADHLLMGSVDGVDAFEVEVEVHLLRSTVGPFRPHMVR